MTATHDTRTITAKELLEDLVEQGYDATLVKDVIEQAARGFAGTPMGPDGPLQVDARLAMFLSGEVASRAAMEWAPSPPPCPQWCQSKPGHHYVDTTMEGRPSRLHELEGGGDPSVDLIADETVEEDGTVVLDTPYLTVWIGGNPIEQKMTGPEVLALAEGLSRAATPAVAAWLEATR